jgi:hypothetical protein
MFYCLNLEIGLANFVVFASRQQNINNLKTLFSEKNITIDCL